MTASEPLNRINTDNKMKTTISHTTRNNCNKKTSTLVTQHINLFRNQLCKWNNTTKEYSFKGSIKNNSLNHTLRDYKNFQKKVFIPTTQITITKIVSNIKHETNNIKTKTTTKQYQNKTITYKISTTFPTTIDNKTARINKTLIEIPFDITTQTSLMVQTKNLRLKSNTEDKNKQEQQSKSTKPLNDFKLTYKAVTNDFDGELSEITAQDNEIYNMKNPDLKQVFTPEPTEEYVDMSIFSQPKPIYVYFPFYFPGQLDNVETQLIRNNENVVPPKGYVSNKFLNLLNRINHLKEEVTIEKNKLMHLKTWNKKEDRIKRQLAKTCLKNSTLNCKNTLLDFYAIETKNNRILLIEPVISTNTIDVHFILNTNHLTNDIYSKIKNLTDLTVIFDNKPFKIINKSYNIKMNNRCFENIVKNMLNKTKRKVSNIDLVNINNDQIKPRTHFGIVEHKQRNVQQLYNNYALLEQLHSEYPKSQILRSKTKQKGRNCKNSFKNIHLGTPVQNRANIKYSKNNESIFLAKLKGFMDTITRLDVIKSKKGNDKIKKSRTLKRNKYFNKRYTDSTQIKNMYKNKPDNSLSYKYYTIHSIENLKNVYFIEAKDNFVEANTYIILHLYVNQEKLNDFINSKQRFVYENNVFDFDKVDHRIHNEVYKILKDIKEISQKNTLNIKRSNAKEINRNRIKRMKRNNGNLTNNEKSRNTLKNRILSSYNKKYPKLFNNQIGQSFNCQHQCKPCVTETEENFRFSYTEDYKSNLNSNFEHPKMVHVVCPNNLLHCLSETVYRQLGDEISFIYIKSHV